MGSSFENDINEIFERYKERDTSSIDKRYSLLADRTLILTLQELHRGILKVLQSESYDPSRLRLLEIGCGAGGNLLFFLQLGVSAQNIVGNELLPWRAQLARDRLPSGIRIVEGDASRLPEPENTFDVVFQSTVFSSILNLTFQEALATRMWEVCRPGGGILWYDIAVPNPYNKFIAPVKAARIAELFPHGRISWQRITVAPPLRRALCNVFPSLYSPLTKLPFVKSHILAWIKKA
ncbi:MAG: class I SAM-dependent methyltransferase [Bdellovibrionota bacterium]|nr:MAG: class I SAM-dependent methyltransferase [Bdellovibrionota bacterium]